MAADFGEGLLRRAGLGDYLFVPACTCCSASYGPGVRLFRCEQCGEYLQCLSCVLDRHRLNPLHCLRVSCNDHETVYYVVLRDIAGMEWKPLGRREAIRRADKSGLGVSARAPWLPMRISRLGAEHGGDRYHRNTHTDGVLLPLQEESAGQKRDTGSTPRQRVVSGYHHQPGDMHHIRRAGLVSIAERSQEH
jgi:hypothetical protein